jgi:glycosyltransferase involved in cell wall biosynthesis
VGLPDREHFRRDAVKPLVSVIVPVYNPGDHIDDCIASLLGQSLPATDYEAIFVDDGSTDETPARLDALAAEHDHVRVEHIPNSGWPGKPRNIGIGMASGEYVYFVDNDDWLEPEALERMLGMAREDGADIVIGKVVGQGKFVPRTLFVENLHNVSLDSPAPLLGLLTPHKLFRKALLDEHGIRFPEGRRRLEDHVFVMDAYFRAQGISVLADYPCYHWMLRDAETNASYRPFEPKEYFDNVREVLDLVEARTEPGPFRDRLMRHWYRGKMLGRVGGGAFVKRDPEYNRELHGEIRSLAEERFAEHVADKLSFNLRVRSHLLRYGSFEDLQALAAREGELRARTRLKGVRGDGTWLSLDVEGELAGADHGPLTFRRSGDRVLWIPPAELGPLPDDLLDVTAELERARLQLLLKGSSDRVEYVLRGKTSFRLEPVQGAPEGTLHAVLSTRANVAPSIVAGGAPLPAGDWELEALVSIAGFSHHRAVKRKGATVTLVARPPARVDVRDDWRPVAPPPPSALRKLARRVPGLRALARRLRARRPAPAPR